MNLSENMQSSIIYAAWYRNTHIFMNMMSETEILKRKVKTKDYAIDDEMVSAKEDTSF